MCGLQRFMAISFLRGNTVTGHFCLEMLKDWLFPELNEDSEDDLIFKQDGAPPHWHNHIRRFLNDILASTLDFALHSWPPQDLQALTFCNIFLWQYVKRVYIPPLHADLDELENKSRLQ